MTHYKTVKSYNIFHCCYIPYDLSKGLDMAKNIIDS